MYLFVGLFFFLHLSSEESPVTTEPLTGEKWHRKLRKTTTPDSRAENIKTITKIFSPPEGKWKIALAINRIIAFTLLGLCVLLSIGISVYFTITDKDHRRDEIKLLEEGLGNQDITESSSTTSSESIATPQPSASPEYTIIRQSPVPTATPEPSYKSVPSSVFSDSDSVSSLEASLSTTSATSVLSVSRGEEVVATSATPVLSEGPAASTAAVTPGSAPSEYFTIIIPPELANGDLPVTVTLHKTLCREGRVVCICGVNQGPATSAARIPLFTIWI